MTEDVADAVLMERCIDGDVDAFGTLIDRYQRPIFSAVLHMVGNYEDARELTQQAFMKAFEHMRSFDPTRKFFSWIYRIAMNESINHIRSRRPVEPIVRDDLPGFPRSEPFGSFETDRAVRQAVLALSPEHRAVIVLRHFLDCSYRDAAEVLQIPEKTVKSRLFEARQILRLALAPSSPDRARGIV